MNNKPDDKRFTFSPVTRSQENLIQRWLKQDYIKEWIHGEGLNNTLSGLSKFIEHYERTGRIDRELDLTQHWLGYDGGTPFIYLLTSNVFDHEQSIYAKHKKPGQQAITLDLFIGEPEYMGKRYATQIITEFLTSHFTDVQEVFIDPEQRNERAIHVYQKTGFEKIDEFIAPWHPVPHALMKLNMKQLLKR